LILRDEVIKPLLAGVTTSFRCSKPPISTLIDQRYDRVRTDIQSVFEELGIAA
jgi:hypothetical protein